MPNRNSALPGAYNDLQYANYTPVVPMRPVKELTDLYKTKGQAYSYVADTTNQLDRAIASTPHLDEDRPLLIEARQQMQNAMQEFEETGDFENRVIDTNKLVSDVSKKLLPIQQRKAQFDSYTKELTAKDKDGNLLRSLDDIKKGMYLTKKGIKPMEYDEDLDTYMGGFSGVNVPTKINFAERVSKVLDDWKANKTPLYDSKGNRLERLGNGYLKAGEVTYTDEGELINAAKSYLANDPDFKERVNFDLMYELESLLVDEEGQRRDMTLEDIEGAYTGDLKNITEAFGFSGDAPLEEQLKNKDITPEELYSRIRLEQVTNSAIQLGVSKESYQQYSDKFLKDDLLLKSLEWQNENRTKKNKPIDDNAYVAIDKIATVNQLHPADYNNILSGHEASKNSLQLNKITLNKAIKSGVEEGEQLNLLQGLIRQDQDNIESFERQLKSIRIHIENGSDFNFVPHYEAYKVLNEEARRSGKRSDTALDDMSLDQYKDKVIGAFIEGESYTGAEQFFYTEKMGRIDNAAEQLKDAYGGSVEVKPFNIDYHRYIIEGDTKDSKRYLSYVKAKQRSFQTTPNNFIYGNRNFSVILDEKYKLDLEDIDLAKSTVTPVIESVSKKPEYMIEVVTKDGVSVGNILANHEGDLLSDSYITRDITVGEAYNRFAEKDFSNLSLTDKAMFNKLSLSYIDNHPAGNAIDDMNLYAANAGEIIPFTLDGENVIFNITPQEDILTREGEEEGEVKAHVPNLIYHLSTPDGKTYLRRKDEEGIERPMWDLKREGDIPIDFNNPSEIKEVYGASLLKQELNNKNLSIQSNVYAEQMGTADVQGELQSIISIFRDNIKSDVSPYVHKNIIGNVKSLKLAYPNLYVTDSYRGTRGVGAEGSEHREGMALDFRINPDSIAITKATQSDLDRLGIKSAAVHEKGTARHVHVVFK